MNLLIYGIKGYMGRTIEELANEDLYWKNIYGLSREIFNGADDIKYDVFSNFTLSPYSTIWLLTLLFSTYSTPDDIYWYSFL